jgi:phage tail tape-measure protein
MGFNEFMDGFEWKEGQVKKQFVGCMAGGVAGGTTGATVGAVLGSIFGPGGTAVGAYIGMQVGAVLGMRSGMQHPKGKVTSAALGVVAGLAPIDALDPLKPPSA